MLIKRVVSALLLLLVVFVGAFLAPPTFLPYFIFIFIVVITYELTLMYRLSLVWMPIMAVINIGLFYWVESLQIFHIFAIFWLVSSLLLKLIASRQLQPNKQYLLEYFVINFAVVVAFKALFFMFQINPKIVAYTIVLIICIDSFGYFIGRLIGRYNIVPSISPGKTLEGYLGALAATILIAYSLNYYQLQPIEFALSSWLLALLIFVFAVIGDLFFSAIKRRTHCKDSGSILPGHGGLLDRLDGYIVVLPMVYILISR